jgi:2-methylcitrate synthase
MAEGKVLTGAGLRGQVAGKTALSTVGKSGAGLTYRGYDVQDLAENCQFEEVAYLIFFGELPTADSSPLTKLNSNHCVNCHKHLKKSLSVSQQIHTQWM